jgi:hypothetical protein
VSAQQRLNPLNGGAANRNFGGQFQSRGGRAPGPGRVIDTSRDNLTAVAADVQAENAAGVPAQGENIFERFGIPELDGPVVTGRGQPPAAWKKGDRGDQAGVTDQTVDFSTGGHVPELYLGGIRPAIVAADRRDRVTVG